MPSEVMKLSLLGIFCVRDSLLRGTKLSPAGQMGNFKKLENGIDLNRSARSMRTFYISKHVICIRHPIRSWYGIYYVMRCLCACFRSSNTDDNLNCLEVQIGL